MPRTNVSLTHEQAAATEILILCARTHMPLEKADRIRSLVAGGIHWGMLIEAAKEHGVAPLVCHQILALCAENLPGDWRESLQTLRRNVAHRNLLLASEMFRLANRFRTGGLLAVPYKGPLLAIQAYNDFALRQFADLDFAIPQRDMPHAAALLASDGYEPVFGRLAPDEGVRPTHSEYQFRRPAERIIVELQTESTLRYFPRMLDFEAMRKRLYRVALAGGETVAFPPEDTLILLAVHGAKHFWERLIWIADISELTQIPGGVAWHELFARSEEMGVGRMVRLALGVAHRMLDAPLSDEALMRIKADAVANRLAEKICARFSLEAAARLPVFQRFRFRVATREKFGEGVRYAFRLATLPTDPDRADLPLPGRFSGAQRWVRPFLLMRRYGIRRGKSQ